MSHTNRTEDVQIWVGKGKMISISSKRKSEKRQVTRTEDKAFEQRSVSWLGVFRL
jgi:hypothetical protein